MSRKDARLELSKMSRMMAARYRRLHSALVGPPIEPWRLGLALRAFGLASIALSILGAIRAASVDWPQVAIALFGVAYGAVFAVRPRWAFPLFIPYCVMQSAFSLVPYTPMGIFIPFAPMLPELDGHPVAAHAEYVTALVATFGAVQNFLRGGSAMPPTLRGGDKSGDAANGRDSVLPVLLFLLAAALLMEACCMLVFPRIWTAHGAGASGGTVGWWRPVISRLLVWEGATAMFISSLLMPWRPKWAFPFIYASLVLLTASGRPVVPFNLWHIQRFLDRAWPDAAIEFSPLCVINSLAAFGACYLHAIVVAASGSPSATVAPSGRSATELKGGV